jgi:hypothetical protein
MERKSRKLATEKQILYANAIAKTLLPYFSNKCKEVNA